MNLRKLGLVALCAVVGSMGVARAEDAERKVRDITIAVNNQGLGSVFYNDFIAGYQYEASLLPGVKLVEAQANFEAPTQVSQLRAAIATQPDGILINHASQAQALYPVIKEASAQNIKVVTAELGTPVAPGVTEVIQDNEQLALLGLEAMNKKIGGKGNIIVIWIGAMVPQLQRYDALQKWLAEHPDIKVIASYGNISKTTLSDTLERTNAVLSQHKDIDAIWSVAGIFAQGALQSQKGQNRWIPTYSVDVGEHDIQLMREPNSPYLGTAAVDPFNYGRICMRLLVSSIYGEKVETVIKVPAIYIDQSNLPAKGEPIHDWFVKNLPAQESLGVTPLISWLYGQKAK